ncbi:hypothetical protein QJQ45_028101 [Haematococcus lacustris]|nr:hypothetical protein QJQ45_028101 [Haematococcus lacustris]
MVDGSWMLVRIVLIANALLFLPFLGALLAQPNAIFDPEFGIFDLAPAGITKNLRTAFYFYGAEMAGVVVMLLLASRSREAAKVKVPQASSPCVDPDAGGADRPDLHWGAHHVCLLAGGYPAQILSSWESGGGVRQLPGYDLHQRIGNLAGICGKASTHQARVKSCAYGEAGIPAELLGHVVPMVGSTTTTVHICFVL